MTENNNYASIPALQFIFINMAVPDRLYGRNYTVSVEPCPECNEFDPKICGLAALFYALGKLPQTAIISDALHKADEFTKKNPTKAYPATRYSQPGSYGPYKKYFCGREETPHIFGVLNIISDKPKHSQGGENQGWVTD